MNNQPRPVVAAGAFLMNISYLGYYRPSKTKLIAPVFAQHPLGQTESGEKSK
jgi:hypothetical protein